jgi:PAS domain S-box-containing protein
MFGYAKEEAIGKNPDDLVARADVLDEAVGISKVALEGEVFHPLKTVRYRKDGKPVDVIVAGSPIMVGKDLIGVVGVYTDISDLKKAEIEREKMQAQLLMAQKMEAIGILAGGVAHDFNNLLTAIQGCTDMALTDMDEDSNHFQELTEARNAAGRAADLTRQLLLFSRRHPIQRVQINLNTTVENLLNMLHRLIGEDIAIRTKLEPDLWTIMADQGTIEQVIMNLAVNARDAMPKGGSLTVKTQNVVLDEGYVKMRAETRKGRFICLSMEDVGIGIDSDILEHIFEPFFTTKGPGKGTGLGLSVVYGIVKQHEGWINVYSEPNKGTTFKVYLPAMPGEANENKTSMVSLEDLKGRGERLLVVEDEKSVREFVQRALSKSGYSVFTAENAEEAVALFEKEQQKFDCIFSDVVLPDTNGIDLVDGILKERPDMHVLLSSGYTDQKSKWPMIQERGYRFLQKPYTLTDLLSTLRELLSETKKG